MIGVACLSASAVNSNYNFNMGLRMSIDKHVSSLDELLDMSAQYFNKVKFESKISPDISQHLKVTPAPDPSDLALFRGQVEIRLSQNDSSSPRTPQADQLQLQQARSLPCPPHLKVLSRR